VLAPDGEDLIGRILISVERHEEATHLAAVEAQREGGSLGPVVPGAGCAEGCLGIRNLFSHGVLWIPQPLPSLSTTFFITPQPGAVCPGEPPDAGAQAGKTP
jgi:hypothetical protein